MLEKIKQTAEFLRSRVGGEMPKVAVILGTGLGSLVDRNTELPRVDRSGSQRQSYLRHYGRQTRDGNAGPFPLL